MSDVCPILTRVRHRDTVTTSSVRASELVGQLYSDIQILLKKCGWKKPQGLSRLDVLKKEKK